MLQYLFSHVKLIPSVIVQVIKISCPSSFINRQNMNPRMRSEDKPGLKSKSI